ncbi:peptidylprolyl isomerase [Lignipirellula cremea]|uniref:Peptidyl-prolyl cis-trans isomerase n=1 Tax=Lignipirellula cremea TaxID=2528010 RepID=A0A518DX46_9BACT|nr:peptidylprolyl isomerase [Lignipirellula cremea]QDU96431.1 Peptidyl-prolyl cis-trans isomerase B [Lignipirellula cremea]
MLKFRSTIAVGLSLVLLGSLGCNSSSNEPAVPSAAISPEPQSASQQPVTDVGNAQLPEGLLNQNHGPIDYPIEQFQPYPDEPGQPQHAEIPVVVFKTTMGDIKMRLFKEKAPVTVANFLDNYVETDFYHGTIFHHVDPGFMIVAGGFTADMERKATRTPITNESNNGLKNKRGAVGMIREPGYSKSATSQFFINLADNPDLDYVDEENSGYCVFGEVLDESMPVIQRIAQAATKTAKGASSPVEPIVITGHQRLE